MHIRPATAARPAGSGTYRGTAVDERVVAVELDAVCGESVEVWRVHLVVAPANVVEAKIICAACRERGRGGVSMCGVLLCIRGFFFPLVIERCFGAMRGH